MITQQELTQYLRHAAQYPDESQWSHTFPEPTTDNFEHIMTLPNKGTFRPGELIAIHVHPTGDGPPLPSGVEPAPHKHDFIEIAFLWEGLCRMDVEGQSVEMHPGDFVILDTQSAHNPHIAPDALLVNLVIEPRFFNDAFFRSFSKDDLLAGFFANTIYSQKAAKRHLIFETNNDSRIRQLFSMLMQEYFSEEVCSKSIVENLTMVLFSTMVRLQLQKAANVTAMEQANDQIVTQILRYISENLDSVTRNTVADRFGYSYSYITTVLQSFTGMTFSELKRSMRLQKAELLLRTTDRPITTVAHDAGFRNITSFYEMFRNAYGTTPLDYRKTIATDSKT